MIFMDHTLHLHKKKTHDHPMVIAIPETRRLATIKGNRSKLKGNPFSLGNDNRYLRRFHSLKVF